MLKIFPTWYNDKWNPEAPDKLFAYDSTANKNVNMRVDDIATTIMGLKTSDDLAEGVNNEYYADAKVEANAVVQSKANKTNVLEKDNTTPYTPTQDYHPATKVYVDSLIWVATEVEAIAGVNNIRPTTPLTTHLIANNFSFIPVPWSDFIYQEALTERSTTSNVYVKMKEIQVDLPGEYTVEYDTSIETNFANDTCSRVYINGNPVGVEHCIPTQYPSFSTVSQNLTLNAGDLVQVYVRSEFSGETSRIKNYKITYNKSFHPLGVSQWSVLLD